jgi:hypothetical protein
VGKARFFSVLVVAIAVGGGMTAVAFAALGDSWAASPSVKSSGTQIGPVHFDGGFNNGGEDGYLTRGEKWAGPISDQTSGRAYWATYTVDETSVFNQAFCCETVTFGNFTLFADQKGQKLCTGAIALGRDHHGLSTTLYYQGEMKFAAASTCPVSGQREIVWGTAPCCYNTGYTISLQFAEGNQNRT